MTRRISRRNVLTGLGIVGIGGVARAAVAQDPVTPPASCPVLAPPLDGTWGLLRNQFARLSVVNHAHTQDRAASRHCHSPFAGVAIIGADGIALASIVHHQAEQASSSISSIQPTSAGGRWKSAGGRIELFEIVQCKGTHLPALGASLQIVDRQSGETVFCKGTHVFPDPTLDGQGGNVTPAGFPLGGTVGFLADQILRVSMVPFEHDAGIVSPCDIVAEVLDATGKLVASKEFEYLEHNQVVLLDVPHPGGKGPTRDTRLEVSVHVRFTPGHHVGGSVQIIDANTGQTIGGSVHPCLIEDPIPTE